MSDVVVAQIVDATRAEGPGLRTAVWVQGCTIRCRGCFNPHLFTFRGGTRVTPAALAARIIAARTDGVTLLGGEPFDQAAALAEVASEVAAAGRSVMTFTGYEAATLQASGQVGVQALLAATDLLVAGPFRADLLDHTRPWVGSTNQEFLVLGDRFPNILDGLAATPDRVEIRVDATGTVAVNGWASAEAFDLLFDGLQRPPTRRSGVVVDDQVVGDRA